MVDNGPLKKGLKTIEHVLLLMKGSDQSLLTTNIKTYREENLASDEGYFIKSGQAEKVKVASV